MRCLGRHPLTPAHAHEGTGVTAAFTDHPRVDVKRDSACLLRPDARAVTCAEPSGLGQPWNLLGVQKHLLDGGARPVRGEQSQVFPVN